MPSELSEPTLDELSAYIDDELDASTKARVAQHVAGCADCRARVDGLRQTVHAVRALPMETPRRTFTIPAQRQQSFRWAPVGWLGGTAAALLIIVIGATQLHFPGPGTASTSTVSGGLSQGAGAPYAAQSKEIAPLDRSNAFAPGVAQSSTDATTVVDPRNSSRSLTISTDAASYSASGVISLHVATKGLSASEAKSVRLLLTQDAGRGGYSVRLGPPTNVSTFPYDYSAAYSIPQMQLSAPVAGNYTLQVTIDTSDGYALVARVPLTITP
jgi:predicted anti-sigma-YlaC factor YlaD